MSWPSETFTPADPSYLFSDDNPNQTQEISRIGEQNVDKEMAGLDISKSSRNKQKKLRSGVWKMFEKYKDENGNDKAKCSLCEKKFDGSSKKGTTHLRNHFRSCQNKRNGGGASGSGDKPAGNSVTDQQLNHLDRVRTCIKQCYWDLPKQVGDDDIILVYNEEKEKLHIYFEKLCCRFSLTITNVALGKYTGFVVHFIDDDWKLQEKIIGFKRKERDQKMEVLKNVLSDLGIDNKISSMVLNSDDSENMFRGQGSLLSNCKFCLYDFNFIEMTCPGLFDEMGYALDDHIRKIFDYITETPSKIGTFLFAARSLGKEVTAEDIQEEVKYWFVSATHLKFALGLKEAFFELEDMDPNFKSRNLTNEQWDVITKFDQFCHEEADFDKFYRDHWITANLYFPRLCCIYKKSLVFETCWNSLNCGEEYPEFVSNARKCWDECSLILAVAAVLDPRFKMDIVKHWYKEIYGDKCDTQFAIFNDYFTGVYNEYAKGTNNFQPSTSGSKEKKSSISFRMLDISGYPSDDPDSGQSLNSELHQYLKHVNFPLRDDFDILDWWRYNSQYFPTLAKMARDFLSIQLVVLHEAVFLEDKEDFDSDIVEEAFMCTRDWLRN